MSENTNKPIAILMFAERVQGAVYSETALARISEITQCDGQLVTEDDILANPDAYRDVEIIFSTWGAPLFDEALLAALPNLKAIFYAAGSVRYFVSDAFWDRDITLTSSYLGNAIPVAEFTQAVVLLALKKAWHGNRLLRSEQTRIDVDGIPGAYAGSKVGIISLGAIAQLVCGKLKTYGVELYAYDPFASDAVFEGCGVTRVDTLDALFKQCDTVTLHTPWLKETEGMITGAMLNAMPEDSTFINTSRGAVVNEVEMLEALQNRPDLFAVLDVVQDEKNLTSNSLIGLSNVFVTPHIAGSMGRERHRLGDMAVEECCRYLSGEPQVTALTRETAAKLA